MKRSTLIKATLASFILLAFTATSAQAQVFSYAAKFVCGRGDNNKIVSPGQYFTMINVHNASPFKKMQYVKRFAIALPGEKPGRITQFFFGQLAPEEAMTIDCENIYQHTQVAFGTFLEGFAVIYANAELDVVSVYTAGHIEVETLHTERVPVRRISVPQTHAISKELRRRE